MDRVAQRAHQSDRWMLQLDDHPARLDVWIVQNLVHLIDRPTGNIRSAQTLQPVLGLTLAKDLIKHWDQLGAMTQAIRVCGKAGILANRLGNFERLAESPPQSLAADGDDQVLVARFE